MEAPTPIPAWAPVDKPLCWAGTLVLLANTDVNGSELCTAGMVVVAISTPASILVAAAAADEEAVSVTPTVENVLTGAREVNSCPLLQVHDVKVAFQQQKLSSEQSDMPAPSSVLTVS